MHQGVEFTAEQIRFDPAEQPPRGGIGEGDPTSPIERADPLVEVRGDGHGEGELVAQLFGQRLLAQAGDHQVRIRRP